MARLIVATVAHIIDEMRLFFAFLFFFLWQVAMAMHFTPATHSLFPTISKRSGWRFRGQRVLKCHILAGDYSTKSPRGICSLWKFRVFSRSISQHIPTDFPAPRRLLLQDITCQLCAREWDKSFVHGKGERCLLTRPPQPPHSAQWADGVVNHTLETINEHARGSLSTDD